MTLKKNNKDLLAAKARIQELSKLNSLDEKLDLKTDVLQLNIIKSFQAFMDEKGWKKKDLAQHLGVSKSHITQLFSGDKRINLKTIVQISDLFEAIPDIKIFNKEEAKRVFRPSNPEWVVKQFDQLTAHFSENYFKDHKEQAFKEVAIHSKIGTSQQQSKQAEKRDTTLHNVG